MKKNIKAAVRLFRKKYNLSEVNEKNLCDTLERQGYTVIYFNRIINDENVTVIVNNLNLEDMIDTHKGFTFVNDKYRLVFVNEDLSEEERTIVLAHEEGHIFCEHTSAKEIIGEDVKQEYEANEFGHYLLNPGKAEQARSWIARHKRITVLICASLLCIVIGVVTVSFVIEETKYYGEYYVTSTGDKYHRKDCIFVKNKTNVRRLTEEEFEKGEYKPCKTCLP